MTPDDTLSDGYRVELWDIILARYITIYVPIVHVYPKGSIRIVRYSNNSKQFVFPPKSKHMNEYLTGKPYDEHERSTAPLLLPNISSRAS